MRLSESLRKNVMRSGGGGIINRFKILSRRNVLFFEDMLAGYIKACEDAGHGPRMREVAKEWGFLYVNFLPEFMESLPKSVLLNSVISKVLVNIGLLDDLKADVAKGKVTLSIRSEAITRCIGRNVFCAGLWEGVIAGLFGRDSHVISAVQAREKSVYSFSLGSAPFRIGSKGKSQYLDMNRIAEEPGELKRYLKMRIIVLKGNRMYFRGKSVVLGENTLFHLLGRKNILMARVAEISCSCFRDVVDPDSSTDSKMVMLKNMLRVFGWGEIRIRYGRGRIAVEIAGPPCGIQKGPDDWSFFANAILGYLFLVDSRYRISGIRKSGRLLELSYSVGSVKD